MKYRKPKYLRVCMSCGKATLPRDMALTKVRKIVGSVCKNCENKR